MKWLIVFCLRFFFFFLHHFSVGKSKVWIDTRRWRNQRWRYPLTRMRLGLRARGGCEVISLMLWVCFRFLIWFSLFEFWHFVVDFFKLHKWKRRYIWNGFIVVLGLNSILNYFLSRSSKAIICVLCLTQISLAHESI